MLSESAANIVENVACRVAKRRGGRLTPDHLLPYLPMSLGLIKSCLDEMSSEGSVKAVENEDFITYEFAAYKDAPIQDSVIELSSCTACEKDLAEASTVLCPECDASLRSELNILAKKNAWPAQAVYEHEIICHGSEFDGPVLAQELSGLSTYTLKNMKSKLDRLVNDKFAAQQNDGSGFSRYIFPKMEYPKDLYRQNMSVIRSYPASVAEEVQIKIIKILFTLGLMFPGMLVFAFMGAPFPILIGLFIVVAPITALLIWRHRRRPDNE